MSTTSQRKRKKERARKKQREQEARERLVQTHAASDRTRPWWKSTIGRVVTMLGVVSAIAGLVALLPLVPVVAASPTDPQVKDQPFTAPFHIQRVEGWLDARDVHAVCYIRRIVAGGITITDSALHNVEMDAARLGAGDGNDVVCKLGSGEIDLAEVDILIDYKVSIIPFMVRRNYSSFVASRGDSWRWLRRPAPPDADEVFNTVEKRRREMREVSEQMRRLPP